MALLFISSEPGAKINLMATSMKHGKPASRPAATKISFDPKLRELWVGATLVKRLDCRAVNQIRILTAFQEETWPQRVDDPLPPASGSDPKGRLRYAIHSLNGCQHPWLIRFFADGTGRGIRWERVESAASALQKNGQKK